MGMVDFCRHGSRRRLIEGDAPGWVKRSARRPYIVPLTHPRVCGLTVPWNLEIKPARVNMSESNHVHLDEQLSLFT
jgi:hypothetical protein